jgi:alkylhydroperoxidase family enzyme
VCRDFATAPIPTREKALFAYLAKLNDAPGSLTGADLEPVKAAGWSDAAIYDAVTVCSLFAFFNRWIDGTGVEDIPKGFYEERLEKFGDRGYAP